MIMRGKLYSAAVPLAALCVGVLCLSGCGASGGPKTVKAKLKATYEDDTPLPPQVVMSLVPEATGGDYTVSAAVPVDGEYALSTSYQGNAIDGAPPGTYKVVIRGTMAPPGGKVSGPHPDCADEKTTPLKIVVSESGTVSPNPLKVPLAK
jgi:hypothetical protein